MVYNSEMTRSEAEKVWDMGLVEDSRFQEKWQPNVVNENILLGLLEKSTNSVVADLLVRRLLELHKAGGGNK